MELKCTCGKTFEIKEVNKEPEIPKREYKKLTKKDIENIKNDYISGLRPYIIYQKYNTTKAQVYYHTRNLQKFKGDNN